MFHLIVILGWVDFNLTVPSSYPGTKPLLPNSHQALLSEACSGTLKMQVYQTHSMTRWDALYHESMIYLVRGFHINIASFLKRSQLQIAFPLMNASSLRQRRLYGLALDALCLQLNSECVSKYGDNRRNQNLQFRVNLLRKFNDRRLLEAIR